LANYWLKNAIISKENPFSLLPPVSLVVININDVNESPVINNQSVSIDENSAMGTIAYTVIATDQENDALSYFITGGNTGNAFSISETTGVIYVSGFLNFESLSVYNLIVDVRDSEYTKTATISIDIIDVNDAPSLNNQIMSVNENSPNNTQIGSSLSASDPDVDDLTFTYSIIGGSGIDAFKISSNGQMSVKDSSLLNYESGITSYTVIVHVSDPHALTDTAVVTIHCNNVNEAPTLQPQSFVIAEHTANAMVVYTMISSDPDTTNAYYTDNIYRITGGSSAFTISADGEISISNSALLDYEKSQTLLLTVKVEDKYDSSLYASETVSISLINMNDNHPIITSQTYSVGKYCTNGVKAAPNDVPLATDADEDLLTYEIIDGNINNAFSISNDGFILINNADQIKKVSAISNFIGIAVTDGTYTATGTIRVNVENYPPSIQPIEDVFTKMDTPKMIVLKVNDSNGDSLTMTVSSNDDLIIPNDDEHITIADTGTTYHFTIEDSPEIIPLKMLPSNLTGTAQIYVTVTDASGISSTTSFALIVDGQPEFYQFTGRIPDTGQTKCYDNENEIPCPESGEDFYGQDGNYNINPQSFTKLDALGNDLPDSATEWVMVRDNISGLIWEVKTDDGSIHDKDNKYTWYDSNPETNGGDAGTDGDGTDTEDFIKSLNDSNFGGFSDWRLPNLMEITSIVNFGKNFPPINTSFFPKTLSAIYWSSTSSSVLKTDAWGVDFYYYGYFTYNDKSSSYYVRAVRGGEYKSFDHSIGFVINNDETITDASTGLMWQRHLAEIKMSWQKAMEYTENLSISDYNDWRLPTIKELLSIIDYSKYYPAMYKGFINNVNWPQVHRSSTPSSFSGSVRVVDNYRGRHSLNSTSLSVLHYVRAVRGGQHQSFGHLLIRSPEQASKWHSGYKMPIKWDTQNISGNVTISLSREGGKTNTYIPIASYTPNDGNFEWTVTQPPSVNCMLKIEPVNEPDKGTTQGLFSILPLQPPVLTFEQTELTLNHMAQTMFTVSDPDSDFLTIVAFSSDQMLIPEFFINLGNSSSIHHVDVSPGVPVSLSLTCFQTDKNYGQAIITIAAYDESGLSASQQLSVSVTPFHSLACKNFEISQTMGMVAAGRDHYLILKPDGRVMSWGRNYSGQLGTSDTKDRNTPVLIQGLSEIISIQTRHSHSLALRSDGNVLAWGYNLFGQLGIGNTTNQSSPVQILTLSNIVAIAAGSYHSLALQADGSVWAWGRCYYENTSNKTQPVKIANLSKIVAIAAGYYHSLAMKSDGTIWAWGSNWHGQLGNGNTTDQYTPVQIANFNNIISIAAGDFHNTALDSDGTLCSWGNNEYGQLGNGNTANQNYPVQLQNISTAIDIECFGVQSFARLTDGRLLAWGDQYNKYPEPAQDMDDIIDLSGNYNSNIFLTTAGNINIWERYPDNQLSVFKEVMPDSHKILDISSSPDKTCVVYKDGDVWCWGNDIDGLYSLSSSTPLQITGLFDIIALEASCYSATESALRDDGTVWK
jgi:alpha-tubulin suppressor-like RCC1 family protein